MRVVVLLIAVVGAALAQPVDPQIAAYAGLRRLQESAARRPTDAAAEADLALNYFLLGQRDLFRASISRALELDPHSSQARYLAARFALEVEQDPARAAAGFRGVLETAPDSFKARYYLGVCLRQLGRFGEARDEFRKAAEASRYSWPARALAEVDMDLNDAQAALAPARKAIELEPRDAQNYFTAGKVYQALERRTEAISMFRKAAQLDPLWEKPHYFLGNLYRTQPETRQQAVTELQTFQRLERDQRSSGSAVPGEAAPPRQAPQARSPEELAAFASVVVAGDPLGTVRAAEGFLARFPKSEFREQALEAEFEAFRERNDYAAAKSVAMDILDLNPANALVLSNAALIIAEAGDAANFALARDYAERAVTAARATSRPERLSRAEFRDWKGNVLAAAAEAGGLLALRKGDSDAALAGLQEAIRARPTPAGADYLRLGEAFVLKRDGAQARAAFERAASLGPAVVTRAAQEKLAALGTREEGGTAASLFSRARALEKQGDLKRAAAAYEEVVSADPKLAEAWHNLGLVYFRLEDYTRAARSLREAIQLKPGLAGTSLFLGLAEFRLGAFQESAKELQAALRAEPGNREALLFLLRDETALGSFHRELADRALRLFPKDAGLNFAVGAACLERIREIARTANELGPGSEEFLWLSLRRAEERQQAEALGKYRQLTARAPEPPLIREYDSIADLLKDSFEKVLELDPGSAEAHTVRGYLHESRNEVEQALAEYRKAGDHFAAGRLLAQNVRLAEAAEEYRAELAANPQNDRARADLGRVYLQLDQVDQAADILRDMVHRYPRDAYAWADLGKARARMGAREPAIEALRKALELDPSLATAHYQLAQLYRKAGNLKLAEEELKRFRAGRKTEP